MEKSSFAKFMLMILFLALLMKIFVRNLVILMSKEFDMSMIGELSFFNRFQVKQTKEGFFISEEKYT